MANGLTYMRKTSSVEGTKQLASTLAPYLHAGDVVVLSGDLGAGKTQFVQGVAAALGVRSQVASPTFNILLSYTDGRIPLYHLDLYRLEDAEELPCDYLEIVITADDQGRRSVRAHSFGSRSRQLLFVWASDSKSRLTKTSGS